MYDWPEVRPATDRLWAAIRDHLHGHGLAAPERLTRDGDLDDIWLSRHLAAGQTCGLPYQLRLRNATTLVGTPIYGLNGCAPGDYFSVIIVGKDVTVNGIDEFRGKIAAFNATDSQSGYSALRHFVAPHAENGRFFRDAICSGAHRESIRLVADGGADIAAVDAVTWELAKRHEPTAKNVRVIAQTPATPGLPVITGQPQWADAVADAFRQGIASLARPDREALFLQGFRRREPCDYDVITKRIIEAERMGYSALQ